MNEVTVLNKTTEMLNMASELLCDTCDALDDVKSVMAACDIPQSRIAVKAIDQLQEDITDGQWNVIQAYIENDKDERNEHLDNLRGYFNENTGTWYEQAERSFKRLTGFPANKWTSLPWTATLLAGHSTLDYLLANGNVTEDHNGKIRVREITEKDAERWGYDRDRINYLVSTNFDELRGTLLPTIGEE